MTAQDESRMWDLELVAPGVHRVCPAPEVTALESMLDQISTMGQSPEVGRGADVARIDATRLLEQMKGAVAAAQVRLTREFEASQLQQQDTAIARANREADQWDAAANDAATLSEATDSSGYEAAQAAAKELRAQARGARSSARRLTRERGRGIGDQIALARRAPAHQGARWLGFSKALAEMPHTEALLTRGLIGEWPATILVRESAVLSIEDRTRFDELMCAWRLDAGTGDLVEPPVVGMSHTRLAREARRQADDLDAEAAVRRRAKAESERRVTMRPIPEAMVQLTGLLPMAGGVAAYAALQSAAKGLKAAGDERCVSQIMADLMVARLTGREPAEGTPVEIGLVMHPSSLAGADDRPARSRDGKVDIPAEVVRAMADHPGAPTWLRRIHVDPVSGVVVDVDTQRRLYDPATAAFIAWRDQTCRHPGCEATIAVTDHVHRHADGGETTRANAQGLCVGHNLVKEMPGWRTRVSDPRPGRHEVETITPTGHVYRSKAPPAMPPPG